MDDLATWISAGAAALSLAVSGVALRWARQSARAAKDSALAARDSADAARDDADVALRAEQAELQAQEDRAVTWRITWLGSAMAQLQNTGEQTAYRVTIYLSPTTTSNGPIRLQKVPDTIYTGGGARVDARLHKAPGSWLQVSWCLADDDAAPVRTKRMGIGNG